MTQQRLFDLYNLFEFLLICIQFLSYLKNTHYTNLGWFRHCVKWFSTVWSLEIILLRMATRNKQLTHFFIGRNCDGEFGIGNKTPQKKLISCKLAINNLTNIIHQINIHFMLMIIMKIYSLLAVIMMVNLELNQFIKVVEYQNLKVLLILKIITSNS